MQSEEDFRPRVEGENFRPRREGESIEDYMALVPKSTYTKLDHYIGVANATASFVGTRGLIVAGLCVTGSIIAVFKYRKKGPRNEKKPT